MNIRALADRGLIVTDPNGGVAVVTEKGWTPIPPPLRDLVLRAIEGESDEPGEASRR